MSRIENPKHEVERADGAIEIRAYAPIIVAEARVRGERRVAINEGFRLIAGYSFGGNDGSKKIEMIAPVQQALEDTANPESGDRPPKAATWMVSFVMPQSWTLETLPRPNDSRVSLRPVSAKKFVAIRFSGLASADKIDRKTAELRAYASAHKIQTTGSPLLAFYNPPWTLPFMRRNEIMLEIVN